MGPMKFVKIRRAVLLMVAVGFAATVAARVALAFIARILGAP